MAKKSKRKALLCLMIPFILTGCGTFPNLPKGKITNNPANTDSSKTKNNREPYTKRHYSESIQHFNVPLSERSCDTFDKEGFIKAFFEFNEIIENTYAQENEPRLIELYNDINAGLLDIKTDSVIANYSYQLDVNNQEAYDTYTEKSDLYNSYYAKTLHLFRSAFLTDYADVFRSYIGDAHADIFSDSGHTVSEEEKSLKKKIEDLHHEYRTLISQNSDCTELKKLYIELVNTNNDYAQLLGYDNYATYAYSNVFSRDYTPEDIFSIEDEIINEFLPLYSDYVIAVTDDETVYDAYDDNYDSGLEKFTNLRKCIQNISPELVESLDHLIANELYDVDDSETKLFSSGFTQEMYSYNDAYIFISPDNMVTDYTTVLHEFGHYNRAYYTPNDAFTLKGSQDIEEIMSQGLQLLCYDYYDDFNSSYGTALAMVTVFDKMQSILDGFTINEAEYRAYTTSDLTIEKLDAIWKDAHAKYSRDPEDLDDWTEISQVFEKPFYYISYATSGLASFEIFAESRTDFNTGIEKYMTITALPKGTKFLEALNAANLNNFFEEGTVTNLSEELADTLL